jgi:beta-ribofuranosylaminobenzene 5'-phosphate synthase
VDGGIGFSLQFPRWILEVEEGDFGIDAELPPELCSAAQQAFSALKLLSIQSFRIRIRESIPLHAGFGAKTSFLLALGYAACVLSRTDMSVNALADILNRGGTSGIGVHSFTSGGFIWDAGRHATSKTRFMPSSKSSASSPLLVVRIPVDWLSIVHFRFEHHGIHGSEEADIFARHCPTSHEDTIQNILLVNCYIVPGLLEKREDLLHSGIRQMQELGFKRVEWTCQDEITLRFRAFWNKAGLSEAVGVSSFGPTLYILTTRPEYVIQMIKRFDVRPVSLEYTTVNNTGKLIEDMQNGF